MPIKLTVKKKSNHSFLKPIEHLLKEVSATFKKPIGRSASEESYEEYSEPESMRQDVMDAERRNAAGYGETPESELPPSEDKWLIMRLGFGNIDLVGEGAMGKVFVGTWDSRDGVERAIKIVREDDALRELNAYRIISNARKKDKLIAKHFPDVEFTGTDPDTGKGVIIMELLEDDPNAKQVIWDMFGGKEIWTDAGEELKDNAAISTGDQKNQIVKRTEALISDPKSRERLLSWITGMLPDEVEVDMDNLLSADFRNMTSVNQKLVDTLGSEIGAWEDRLDAVLADPDSKEPRYYGEDPSGYLEVIYTDYDGSAAVINFINMLVVNLIQGMKKRMESDSSLDEGDWNGFWASTANILKDFTDSARQWTPIGISPNSRDYRIVGAPKELEGGGYPGVKSVLAAIKKLYELTGLIAKDMHDGNVMVRHDTKDIVIVDVGLFKREKGWKPGMKESREANFLRLILARIEYEENFYKKMVKKEGRNKHHPTPGRHKKYFGSSVYDLPAMHGDADGDDGGDGGGGDGNRSCGKKKKKRILKITRGKKK